MFGNDLIEELRADKARLIARVTVLEEALLAVTQPTAHRALTQPSRTPGAPVVTLASKRATERKSDMSAADVENLFRTAEDVGADLG